MLPSFSKFATNDDSAISWKLEENGNYTVFCETRSYLYDFSDQTPEELNKKIVSFLQLHFPDVFPC